MSLILGSEVKSLYLGGEVKEAWLNGAKVWEKDKKEMPLFLLNGVANTHTPVDGFCSMVVEAGPLGSATPAYLCDKDMLFSSDDLVNIFDDDFTVEFWFRSKLNSGGYTLTHNCFSFRDKNGTNSGTTLRTNRAAVSNGTYVVNSEYDSGVNGWIVGDVWSHFAFTYKKGNTDHYEHFGNGSKYFSYNKNITVKANTGSIKIHKITDDNISGSVVRLAQVCVWRGVKYTENFTPRTDIIK